jgi:hypothetical protein
MLSDPGQRVPRQIQSQFTFPVGKRGISPGNDRFSLTLCNLSHHKL